MNSLSSVRAKHSPSAAAPRAALSRLALVCAIAFVCTTVPAATLVGEVVAVADGDTFTVLDASKNQYKVRLAGIDAPEKRQAFGEQSRQNLASLVFRRQVVVEWQKTDRYGRIVGKVRVGTVTVDLEQVRVGLAWHYKAYANEQSPADRDEYAKAEVEARRARRGLWLEASPVAPWDFRRRRY